MHKQSLFHISKRDALPWYQRVLIRGGAILLALIVCALVTMLLTGENPISIYGTIFWNIGAEGQVLIGCLATAACMICLGDKLPSGLLILVMLAAALAAGALWGFLPSFFKAKWNTNETLFTLMMNYIATQLAAFFIIIWEVPKGAGKIGIINTNAATTSTVDRENGFRSAFEGTNFEIGEGKIGIINQNSEAGWLPVIGGKQYLLTILVVAIMTILMYIYLTYSKHGYEIAVVGESQRTASYAGIKVERVIIRTMVLSGAVCGLMGLLLTAGTDHTLTTTIVGGRGFTAVMVSWLAKFNPIVMVFTSLLLVVLSRGASEISSVFSLNHSFADILTGIILFFIIGSEFFLTYKVSLRTSKKEA